MKSTELLVLLILFFLSLRVINWFEYPYIIVGGDFRPPLIREAFVNRVLYTWDQTDFGIPSVYTPRILDPFNLFTVIFNMLGLNTYLTQIVTVFLIYFLSSTLMYAYVKEIADNNITIAFFAAFFLASNVFLVNDREQTAVGFMNTVLMILPCLLTFTKSLKENSYKLIIISAFLFNLTYATFPNYRTSLICLIALGVTTLFIYLKKGEPKLDAYHGGNSRKFISLPFDTTLTFTHLKLLTVFFSSLLLSSIWIITIIITSPDIMVATYTRMTLVRPFLTPQFYDVTRLIAKWSFYEGCLGRTYVPYATVYQEPLMILLSYLPPVLAFASLLISKSRKLSIYYSGIAVVSLFLTSAFTSHFNDVYLAFITELPLMRAFRESTHWVFFLILSYSILIGTTVSALRRKLAHKGLQAVLLGLIATLFISTSFPLVTGDVTRNWLDTNIKGSYFPPSYTELNNMLSKEHWTILLPQRSTYVTYNFSKGPLSCGNPYPLIFSKPIISECGSEYIGSKNRDLIDKIYELTQTLTKYKNVGLEGDASASSVESEGYEPGKANDGLDQTRWSSDIGMPQWLEIRWNQPRRLSKINILFEDAYAESYTVQTWDGHNWTNQTTVENNTSIKCEHVFPQPLNTTRIRLYLTKTSSFGSVSIRELEVYAPIERVSNFLGMLGIKHLILEKNLILGNTSSVDDLKISECEDFIPVKEWNEVALFENSYVLQKIYIADNILKYLSLNDMYATIENSDWNTLKHSVFINATSLSGTNKTLITPENFVWRETSPTKYEANAESNGPFILVFLENYDEHWKLYINDEQVSETNHLEINAFANGWLINEVGNLTIAIRYETQNLFTASIAASIILPVGLLILLSEREIKKIASLIQREFKKKN